MFLYSMFICCSQVKIFRITAQFYYGVGLNLPWKLVLCNMKPSRLGHCKTNTVEQHPGEVIVKQTQSKYNENLVIA